MRLTTEGGVRCLRWQQICSQVQVTIFATPSKESARVFTQMVASTRPGYHVLAVYT